MNETKHTPITDDTFVMGYKVGGGLHGTLKDAQKAILRGEGGSWIPLYREHHCAGELLEALKELVRPYGVADVGMVSAPGPLQMEFIAAVRQAKDAIAKATGEA